MVTAKRVTRDDRVLVDEIDQDELLSIRQCAETLKISPSNCWRRIRAGEIPSRRIGRRVLVRRVDLATYTAYLLSAAAD